MNKARIRFHKPNSIETDGIVQIIITDDCKNHVYCTLPISSFAYAIMGTSGIDCEMDIKKLP